MNHAMLRMTRGTIRTLCSLALLVPLLGPLSLAAAQSSSSPHPAPHSQPRSQPIDAYIHTAWSTLTRSMSDCKSVADPKLKSTPVLYLPRDLAMPANVAAMQKHCHVRVLRLPIVITHFDQIRESQIPMPGLLYLPHPYVVPGGRFNEMYGWDSFFILKGLLDDHHIALARGIVENFFFEIAHYGGILNANRTYYFTRSQPPFLSSMIRAIYDAEAADGHTQAAHAWLAEAYPYAVRDHRLWMSPIHQAGQTGLARYFDTGQGPVPEMADDSTYYQDVIRWLLAHPDLHTGYLVYASRHPDATERAELTQLSCNPKLSNVCVRAHVHGYWLTRAFYKGDRAMRESGFDTTFRFGPFSGSTQHFAPVGLNALLYKYERDLAWMATQLGKPVEAAKWNAEAETRRAKTNRYLWNAQKKMYFDYNFETHRQSSYAFITTFYPLWAGAADKTQQQGVIASLPLFEHPGGLAISNHDSGVQWDLPYGWAPTEWMAVQGLLHADDQHDARRIAAEFNRTVRTTYQHDHAIYEKYDVVNRSNDFRVTAGYTQNVVGFGWTNAVYLEFEALLANTGQ
uniref:Trehalase n=1 Tax=Acidobacterium capsulatum TaxID=33075 RepID=A0A7V4XT94_9BACT